MTWVLDHVFVFVPVGAAIAERLVQSGLLEGPSRTHPGQGTANRSFFFDNGMLELLWLADRTEAESPPIRRTHLSERGRWPDTGVSPFGVCVRSDDDSAVFPFETWPYTPPYMPEGKNIPIAVSADALAEPLLFVSPWGGRTPRAVASERGLPLDHPNGARHIKALHITLPVPEAAWSEPLQAVTGLSGLFFEAGDDHAMVVELDGGPELDLRPACPVILRSGE